MPLLVLNLSRFFADSFSVFPVLSELFLIFVTIQTTSRVNSQKKINELCAINNPTNTLPSKMKKFYLILVIFGVSIGIAAQTKYSTFYYQRASLFEKLPVHSNDIVFVGNSITNGGEWAELFQNKKVKNRGISGDICEGVFDRLTPVTKGKPHKIFLMIGINDMARGTSVDSITAATLKIICKIQSESPRTRIYLQSILPVNDSFGMFQGHMKRKADIKPLNEKLRQMANAEKITFIDLYSHFVIPDTELMNPAYTNDGLHLTGEGYIKWVEIVKPYLKAKK